MLRLINFSSLSSSINVFILIAENIQFMRSVFQSFGLQQYQGLLHLIGASVMPLPCLPEQQAALKNPAKQIPTIGFQPYCPPELLEFHSRSDSDPNASSSEYSESTNPKKPHLNNKIKSKPKKPRKGSYKKYTHQEKLQAVEKIINGEDINNVMLQLRIPRRSLLRWKKNGCQRKEGGGRPSDFRMEAVLFQKIINKEICGEDEIRDFALQASNLKNFKASKGWYVKFGRRFNEYKQKRNRGQLVEQQQRGQE